jgi:hypothetical protein
MTAIVLILAGAAWHQAGKRSFIYWWTRDWDYTTQEKGLAFSIGFFGPIAFLMGWSIHHKRRPKIKRVLIPSVKAVRAAAALDAGRMDGEKE